MLVYESLEYFLFESRLDDLISKYSDMISSEKIKELSSKDPSGNNAYLKWMIDMAIKGNSDLDIINTVTDFHKRKSALQNKDIYSYKELRELKDALELSEIGSKSAQLKSAEDGKVESKVYEDDRWVMWIPLTHAQSRVLCHGSKWCTGMNDPQHWNQYRYDNNVDFFYIMDKKQKLGSVDSMFAIARQPGGKNQYKYDGYNYVDAHKTVDLNKYPQKMANIIKGFVEPSQNKAKSYFRDFPNSNFRVFKNEKNKWGAINKLGKEVIPFIYDNNFFNPHGGIDVEQIYIAALERRDEATNKKIIDFFSLATGRKVPEFSGKYLVNNYNVVTRDNRFIIYETNTKTEYLMGVYDGKKDKFIIPIEFIDINFSQGNVAICQKENKTIIYDLETAIPIFTDKQYTDFKRVKTSSGEYVYIVSYRPKNAYNDQDVYGVIDKNKKTIIPFKYQDIDTLNDYGITYPIFICDNDKTTDIYIDDKKLKTYNTSKENFDIINYINIFNKNTIQIKKDLFEFPSGKQIATLPNGDFSILDDKSGNINIWIDDDNIIYRLDNKTKYSFRNDLGRGYDQEVIGLYYFISSYPKRNLVDDIPQRKRYSEEGDEAFQSLYSISGTKMKKLIDAKDLNKIVKTAKGITVTKLNGSVVNLSLSDIKILDDYIKK